MIAKSKTKPLVDVAKLTKAQAKVELMRLALELEGHDRRYYQDDAPSVTDAEYDALRQRFNAIEKRFPEFVSSDSPSQKVGARRPGASRKVRHAVPMLSLDNAFAEQDVLDFAGRIDASSSSPTTTRSRSAPSRRSTGCRCRCAMRAANSSPPRPAATAPRARTSPPISARSRTCRKSSKAATCLRSARCAARST